MGTKSDLVNEKEKERQVQKEEAERKCSKNKIEWAEEISIKDISEEDLQKKFKDFLKKIHEKRKFMKKWSDYCLIACC